MHSKYAPAGHPSRREILKYSLYLGAALGLPGSLGISGCNVRRNNIKPNIIMITLDTTRADRLGCYGCLRRTSPNIDLLAGESILFRQAITPSSWTLPAHASLFTGKFTSSHGARYDAEGPLHLTDAITGPAHHAQFRARGLSRDEQTLPGLLKEAGYRTAAVVGGPWLKKVFGLNKGFDYYNDDGITHFDGRPAQEVSARAEEWVQESGNEPFFLFLNYFDPHRPYAAPNGYSNAFLPKNTTLSSLKRKGYTTAQELKALYDGEVLYMDYHIGHLLQKVKDLGLYDDTWIILTADHGELLGEHGGKQGHGGYLYQEVLHVPLIMKYPKGEMQPGQTNLRIQLTDILAIVCNRLEIPLPKDIQSSAPPEIDHPIIAEWYPLDYENDGVDLRAIFENDFKLIWNNKGKHRLYNLKDDPHEKFNLSHLDGQRTEQMAQRVNAYLSSLPKPGIASPAQEVDEETKKALKSLGYL